MAKLPPAYTEQDDEAKDRVIHHVESMGGKVNKTRRLKPGMMAIYLLQSFELNGQRVDQLVTEYDSDSQSVHYIQWRLKPNRYSQYDHYLGSQFL